MASAADDPGGGRGGAGGGGGGAGRFTGGTFQPGCDDASQGFCGGGGAAGAGAPEEVQILPSATMSQGGLYVQSRFAASRNPTSDNRYIRLASRSINIEY
jgi:hypothetical protein